mmetsp:Transcript_19665/g.35363  ORF Transcript_19665/g.35363 Transcript_19665/m.35363 type:complete len:109 (-) Transcript_19665:936-1262(-)
MNTYLKATFLALATLAASASADTLGQKIWGTREQSEQLHNSAVVEEYQETRPFDAINVVPNQIAGLEEDEYDAIEKKDEERVFLGKAEKNDDDKNKPTPSSRSKVSLI